MPPAPDLCRHSISVIHLVSQAYGFINAGARLVIAIQPVVYTHSCPCIGQGLCVWVCVREAATFIHLIHVPAFACTSEASAFSRCRYTKISSYPEKGQHASLSFVVEVISASNQSADEAVMCR